MVPCALSFDRILLVQGLTSKRTDGALDVKNMYSFNPPKISPAQHRYQYLDAILGQNLLVFFFFELALESSA